MSTPYHTVTLLANNTSTGNWVDWPGGDAMLIAAGDFNGATLRVEFQDNDGETIVASPLNEAGHAAIKLPQANGRLRGVLVGGKARGVWATLTRLNAGSE